MRALSSMVIGMSRIFFKIFLRRKAFSSDMIFANKKKPCGYCNPALSPMGVKGKVDTKSTRKDPLKM